MGNAFTAGGWINEWIWVARSPTEYRFTAAAMKNLLMGQGATHTEFDNIVWGQSWTWAQNTAIVPQFGVAINTTLMGSGDATNGDKLYVYRLVSLAGPTPTPGSFVELPSVRLLLQGQLKSEAEYAQIMRMRRVYELQQGRDED